MIGVRHHEAFRVRAIPSCKICKGYVGPFANIITEKFRNVGGAM